MVLKFLFLQIRGLNQNYICKVFNVLNSSDLVRSVSDSTLPQTFKLTLVPLYNNHSLNLTYYVSKVNKSLRFLNKDYSVLPVNCIQFNLSLNKIHNLIPNTINNSIILNVRLQIKGVDTQPNLRTLTLSGNQNRSDLNTNLINPLMNSYISKFYTLNNQQFGIMISGLNSYSNIRRLKQDR